MEKKTLKIYFTSDMHGYFYPTTYGDTIRKNVGLFSCISNFKRDENTLVIDDGDILQGSAFAYYCKQVLHSAKPIADIMNDCGFDYYTLGNHDFNYGQDYQREYRENFKAKCLCQNVCDAQGNPLYPYEICTLPNGLKIGLVGIVTDYINVWEKKENLVGIQVNDPFIAAKKALEELKGKVDLTVCIYHGGFESDLNTGELLSTTTENVGYKICRELDFNVLLTGHQHMSIDGRELFGTYIVQPLDQAKEYHYLEITVENGSVSVRSEKRKADANSLDQEGLGKSLYEKYLHYENEIQEWLNQPIGHLNKALLPEAKVDMAMHGSPIADFINRVQLYFSGAELSIVGLANEVAGFKKDVSTRDIIATYPYPNTLVVCKINGAQVKAAIERSAEYFDFDEEGNLCVAESFVYPKQAHYNYDYYAGVDYIIDPTKPMGSRVVSLNRNGADVQETDEFTLCMNNYRYSGAGEYPMYPECPLVKEINVEMVELLMEYFRENPYVEM